MRAAVARADLRPPGRARRLLGQVTRGTTAPNRLRKTDAFLAIAYPGLARRLPGPYVDLGYGAAPITCVETLRRLRRLDPGATVLGVEIDPARVAAAQPFAEAGLEFRLGGFDLPLRPGERAGALRALNVLRQYDEAAVAVALAALARHMAPGALLIEGTSDPTGRLLAFEVHRRAAEDAGGALDPLGLVLAPSPRRGFAPRQLQAVLPKRFVHRAEPGGDVDRFFAAWQAAWERARRRATDPRRAFVESARWLADEEGQGLDRRDPLLRRGFLWLGPEWPARAAGGARGETSSARSVNHERSATC